MVIANDLIRATAVPPRSPPPGQPVLAAPAAWPRHSTFEPRRVAPLERVLLKHASPEFYVIIEAALAPGVSVVAALT